MRGKLQTLRLGVGCLGITPACAGKTVKADLFKLFAKDHPRVCGENQVRYERPFMCAGSPPRVRGKLLLCAPFMRRSGITPACAGKTRKMEDDKRTAEDHPRVCGENLTQVDRLTVFLGSPPRVRGKPLLLLIITMWRRITPACAGKTTDVALRGWLSGDHPRVCGENF